MGKITGIEVNANAEVSTLYNLIGYLKNEDTKQSREALALIERMYEENIKTMVGYSFYDIENPICIIPSIKEHTTPNKKKKK